MWKDLKIAVHCYSPSNLTELEKILKEEWEKIPKSRCEKLIDIPKTVFDAEGTSTKYWLRGVNTDVNEIFLENMFSLCHYRVLCVDGWEKEKKRYSILNSGCNTTKCGISQGYEYFLKAL
jgi:hypothetical protein